MRIGHGYDVHRFGSGDSIVLGGVRIAHSHGLIAHSDGDVLIHAVCDALLGAVGMGDIGRHFPDTDPAYSGIDSRQLLVQVQTLVSAAGWMIGNLDATVIAQAPRLAPHIPAMEANLAADLDCRDGQINVKATTTEKLGFTGRGEGIAAHAVVLLVASDK
jgi:2-C-methyl-D-erythritol 2,4-cyclodiphosphate synthase